MKLKRIMTAALTFLILISLMAGCQNEAAPDVTGGDASQSASPSTGMSPMAESSPSEALEKPLYPIVEEKIDLSVAIRAPGYALAYMDDGWNNYPVGQHMEEVTNVHIEWHLFEGDSFRNQFTIMLASEEYYDIIMGADGYYPGGVEKLLADDICIDILPYLADYAPDFYEKVYQAYPLYAKTVTTDSGAVGGMFSIRQSIDTGSTIRKDWLDKLNMEIPQTYDELHNALYAFKTELGVEHPMLMTSFLHLPANAFASGYDVYVYRTQGELNWQVDDNGVVSASFMTPQYKEYLMLLNQWYNEGILTDASTGLSNAGLFDDYIKGNTVGYWSSSTNSMSQAFYDLSGDPDYNPYPMAEVTKTPGETVQASYVMNVPEGAGYYVSSQCKYPEAAIAYMNWAFTDEGSIWVQFGEENVAHVVNADGSRSFTELITKNPEGLPQMIAEYVYTFSGLPLINTRDKATIGYTREVQYLCHDIWNSNITNNHMYFGDMTAEEYDSYSGQAGDVATMVDEFSVQFVYGHKSFDEYDTFIANAIVFGIEELTALKQAAYDRYLER